MTGMLRRGASAAVLSLALACGSGGAPASSGDPGSGSVTAPATAAEWCDAYHALLAQHHASCHHGALGWAKAVLDPALLCADPVKAVATGRARYDRSAASACLTFIDGAECVILDGLFAGTAYEASCGSAIAGTVAVGGTCYADADCASARCDADTTCPGTCAAASGANGRPCQDRRDCAPGFYCTRSASLGYLTCESISSYPGLGGTCSAGVTPCQPGLYCDGAVTPNVCRALKTSGACSSTDECAPGLRCAGGSCVSVPGPAEVCAQVLNGCGPGLYCGSSSTCAEEVGVGGACTQVGGYYAGCIGGTCDATGACLAASLAGAACTTDLACAPRWVCRSGACVAPPCAEP